MGVPVVMATMPTSRTGIDDLPAPSGQSLTTVRIRGFTLVELLIVIALLALISALLSPMLLPSAGRTINQTSNEISLRLRELRREAQSSKQHLRFWIDTSGKRYREDKSAAWRALPKEMTVELTTAESLLRSADSGTIDFYPDGSSTRIVLGLKGRTAQIDIEWLTGRVRVSGQSQ